MKGLQLLLLKIIFGIILFQPVLSQGYEYRMIQKDNTYEYIEVVTFYDSIIVRDTIRDTIYIGASSIKELSENLNMSYNDFINSFLKFAEANKDTGVKGDKNNVLLKDFISNIYTEIYKDRYVVRSYFLDINNNLICTYDSSRLAVNLVPSRVPLEYVFIQLGKNLTDNFLKTRSEQEQVVTNILQDIKANTEIKDRQVIVNFDFQDYDFSDKRALFQFAKSVSLVMDSIKVKKIREAKLYFTFNKSVVEEYKSYVVGLYEMIDGVYVFDPQTGVREIVPKDKLGTLINIRNQFLFARFDRSTFPDVASDQINYQIVHELMNSDYPEIWEDYFFAIICILLLLVIGVICYLYIPRFSNYINTNYLLALCVTIIIGAEIVVLLIYMIEEMGSSSRIITLKDIIAFQLLLFLAVPILIGFFNKKEIP